jgi:hypothetical protein
MSAEHDDFKFSVTIHTDDLALLGCLRALCQHCQETGNVRIGWGGTKQEDWASGGHKATFRFTAAFKREQFLSEAERLLPKHLWQKVAHSDNNPATPQSQPVIEKSRVFTFGD